MKVRQNLKIALIAVVILWFVLFLDLALPADMRLHGIRPRQIDGLWGIIFAPFLHGNFGHLIANSSALFVLLAMSLSYSRKLTIVALLITWLVGGGLVWLFGSANTVHIGASGIIFGLIGFLMFTGVFRREWKALVLSIIVILGYGGALLSLLVYVPGISWTGHFFGFLTGVLTAWWTRRKRRR